MAGSDAGTVRAVRSLAAPDGSAGGSSYWTWTRSE